MKRITLFKQLFSLQNHHSTKAYSPLTKRAACEQTIQGSRFVAGRFGESERTNSIINA
jgi:hypothetical protein